MVVRLMLEFLKRFKLNCGELSFYDTGEKEISFELQIGIYIVFVFSNNFNTALCLYFFFFSKEYHIFKAFEKYYFVTICKTRSTKIKTNFDHSQYND